MKITYELKEIKWGIPFLKRIKVKNFNLFIVFYFVATFISSGQDLPQEMWHPGIVVLDSQDTLRGNIQYDFESNLVQFSGDKNRVRTFTSQNVLFFRFNCQYFNRPRTVYSITYDLKGRMKVPVFFEILEEGYITFMTREYVVIDNNRFGNPMYRPSRSFGGREILTYDYFLLTNDGVIHKYSEKKKDLYSFFGVYKEQVEEFVKDRRLKTTKQGDLVTIMKYYNGLVSGRK